MQSTKPRPRSFVFFSDKRFELVSDRPVIESPQRPTAEGAHGTWTRAVACMRGGLQSRVRTSARSRKRVEVLSTLLAPEAEQERPALNLWKFFALARRLLQF